MKRILFFVLSIITLLDNLGHVAKAQWVQSHGLDTEFVSTFVVLGTNLFAGTGSSGSSFGDGIFRSTDNGVSWTATSSGLPPTSAVHALAVLGTDLFAGMDGWFDGRYGNIYRSTDSGSHWTRADTGLATSRVRALAVLGTDLYAGTENNGVYRSTDNGSHWTAVNNGLNGKFIFSLLVHGTDIFAGVSTAGVFLSKNNSSQWTNVDNGSIANVTDLAVFGMDLFAGTANRGLFRSTNNGLNWANTNADFSNTEISAFAVSGTDFFAVENNVVSLLTDHGSHRTFVSTGLQSPSTNIVNIVNTITALGAYLFVGSSEGVWRRPLSEMTSQSLVERTAPLQSSPTCYPNPATHSCTINFSSSSGLADVRIVNLLGEDVAQVFAGKLEGGEHSLVWNMPDGLLAGTYRWLLRINENVQCVPVMVGQ